MPAPPYYVDIVSCEENCPIVCNHNVPSSLEGKTWKGGSKILSEDKSWIPRGSTTRADPGNLDLMWILINPGTPQETVEYNFYSGKEGGELADAAWAFTEKVLEGKVGLSPALSDAIKDAATVLNCDEPLDVLDRCLITNVVRCSTSPIWSESLRGMPGLEKQIVSTCFNKYMGVEVEYWNPKAIIAGSAVSRDALHNMRLAWTCKNCGVKSDRFWDRPTKQFICRACRQSVTDWGYVAHSSWYNRSFGAVEGRKKRDKDIAALAGMLGSVLN